MTEVLDSVGHPEGPRAWNSNRSAVDPCWVGHWNLNLVGEQRQNPWSARSGQLLQRNSTYRNIFEFRRKLAPGLFRIGDDKSTSGEVRAKSLSQPGQDAITDQRIETQSNPRQRRQTGHKLNV